MKNCIDCRKEVTCGPRCMSCVIKHKWTNPEYRKGQSTVARQRQLLSRGFTGKTHTLEVRQKIRRAHKGKPKSKEHRQKIGKALKGKPKSREHRENMSRVRKGKAIHTQEFKEKISQVHIKLWQDPEYRRKMIQIRKDLWKENPKFRRNILKNLAKARYKRPTSLEIKLGKILQFLELPYQYTGDGTQIVNGMYPDFWWEEEKRVIEAFGEYWHKEEDENQRISAFAKVGVKCLVIWGNELQDEAETTQKIRFWHCQYLEEGIMGGDW